jgi:rod shape-determining protein MreD
LLSFLYEGYYGIALGVLFGLIQDLSFALIIGPSSLSYLLVALLMSELRRYLYRDSVLNIFLASVIGTTTYYGIYWVILAIFDGIYRIEIILFELPALLGHHFIIMVLFYAMIGRRSIRHPEDRYYKGNRSIF